MDKQYIIIHHSATEDGSMLKDFDVIKAYHLKIGDRDIGYHWVLEMVEGQLKWIKGRDESDTAAACPGRNQDGIHLCVVGNFELTVPTYIQYKAVADKCVEIMTRHPIKSIGGHREYNPTKCPGKNFDIVKVLEIIADAAIKISDGNRPSNWAVKAVEWCKIRGISDGNRPKHAATREEVMMMLYQAYH